MPPPTTLTTKSWFLAASMIVIGSVTSRTWWGRPWKYASTGFLLTVTLPSPFGSRRHCATEVLRRPVAQIASFFMMSLLGARRDGGRVRVLVVDVDLQANQLLAGEAVLREHAAHGEHDDLARVAVHL